MRRFRASDSLRDVCDWVTAHMPGGLAGRQIVMHPRLVLAAWPDYDMAELQRAAEFETLALTGSAAGGQGEGSLAGRTLSSVGLSGRVALNLCAL